MFKNNTLRKLTTGALMLVAMFALAGSALFFTDNASAQIVQDDGSPAEVRQGKRGSKGFLSREEKAQITADAIGVTVEDLQAAREAGESWKDLADANGVAHETVMAALESAEIAAINQAVADGEITQEQADEIFARKELKALASQIIDKEALKQAKADALGLSVEELDQAKEDGVRLSELAEANGTTVEEVKAAVDAAKTDMVNAAVADGTITQEQADEILDGGNGRRGGNGGEGRPGRGNGQGQPPVDGEA